MELRNTLKMDIKQINRSNIYHLLRQESGLTRQDIVIKLNMSLPTVVQNLTELIAEGLLKESGDVGNTGGRRAKTYSIVEDARIALGLDITPDHFSIVAVDLNGGVIQHTRISLPFSRKDEYYKKLGQAVDDFIKENRLKRDCILGVGIGVPGLVTGDHQSVVYGKTMDFTGTNIKDFSVNIQFPVLLYHDTNAAGYAETWSRDSKENLFYLMLSGSVGGSVFINGQGYNGDNERSAEVGHLTIVPDGKTCYCGKKGCADPYLSSWNLTNYVNGTLSDFFGKLDNGEEGAKKVWQEYACHLAVTINFLRMLFDCKVILGGEVGTYLDNHIDELRDLTLEYNTFDEQADFLTACMLKTAPVAAGSALPFIEEFLKNI